PQTMRERRQTGSASPSLGEQPPEVKVVLSLREDYLGALQELTADIPGIFDDRVRLTALTAAQARQAIQEPARLRGDEAAVGSFVTPPFEYTEEALADIFDFLKGKSEAIEPFQLQLVCRSVEEQVAHRQGRDNLTVGQQDLGGRRRLEAIVQNFYQRAIARLPKESFFYELSHDSLAHPILPSRPWLPRKVRAIARLGLAAMLVLVLIISGYYQYQARLAAEAAEKRAREARAAAEQVLEFLTFDLGDKLAPIGRLDIVGGVQEQMNAYYQRLGTEGQDAMVLRRRAVAYHNQGDRLLAQGRLAEAQKAYQDSLAIAQKLTAHDPSNTGWQRDLSVSFDRLGDVLLAQGKLGEAQKAYQDSL
ncbi:MAG TPA: tetratricopeptide repeat protein, partial [Gammaproteobacteria bacterium]|nr:tetratricopeptide repeat protein [Gammaproteobacteria bacterium]